MAVPLQRRDQLGQERDQALGADPLTADQAIRSASRTAGPYRGARGRRIGPDGDERRRSSRIAYFRA